MLITIDTDKDNAERIRSLIGFLAHLYNLDTDEAEVPEGTNTLQPERLALGPALTEPFTAPVQPPPSNVLNFPVPPPPATTAAVTGSTSSPVPTAAAAQSAASAPAAPAVEAQTSSQTAIVAEYDSAGLAWDARIHNKSKTKKRDQTWKLRKLMNATPAQEAEFAALVLAVTAELASRKIATPASPSVAPTHTVAEQIHANMSHNGPAWNPSQSVPPPPSAVGAVPPPPATVAPQVSLPDTVPVPPVASVAPAETVLAPNAPVAGVVPVPPVAAAGPLGVSYRSLIDKMTAGTKAQTLTANKVLEIVQASGCPNLQQLNQLPAIWADIDAKLDLALAGLL